MKEKNKNILKGLGIGALACFGMFALTGCSVELNQDQIDKVMQVVDQSDKFMDDTLNLLEKQNAKLSKEEGWDLYQLSVTKFLTNQDGIRNNLKMTVHSWSTLDDGDGLSPENLYSYYFYNDLDQFDIVLEKLEQNEGIAKLTFVENGEEEKNVYEYSKNGAEYEKSFLGEGLTENYYPILMYVDGGCSSEDIIGCELLGNGNYKISFIQRFESVNEEDEIAYYYYTVYEITSDATIVSQNAMYAEVDLGREGVVSERFGGTITYEYGVVQESDFADILAEAKTAEITSEE